MRLYYYTAKQWGLKSLWEKRLKIGRYEDLNDPFELMPYAAKDIKEKQIIKEIATTLARDYGVICFSENWTSTLMWAHYGDKHKGVCLGFDIPEDLTSLTQITYIKNRLEWKSLLPSTDQRITLETIQKCLSFKHIGWNYEAERRLRVPLTEKRDDIYYLPFNSDVSLREVIIGAKCSLTAIEIAEAIGNNPLDDVDIFHARPANKSFEVCRNKAKPTSTLIGTTKEEKQRIYLAAALRNKTEQIKT